MASALGINSVCITQETGKKRYERFGGGDKIERYQGQQTYLGSQLTMSLLLLGEDRYVRSVVATSQLVG